MHAAFTEDKIYYSFDIYVLKLQNVELYPLITAIINSKLAQYYWNVKSRKRVEGSFPKINSSDFLSLPIPKNIENHTVIIHQLQQLSTAICEGTYSFAEKENEIVTNKRWNVKFWQYNGRSLIKYTNSGF